MGLGILFIAWAIVGMVVAVLGMGTLALAATLATRGVPKGRWKVIIAAGLFPILCLCWGAVTLVSHGIVNGVFLQQDSGSGNALHSALSNDYQILILEYADHGWVYNTKTQTGVGKTEQEDAIARVQMVQVAMPYIVGATDSKASDNLGAASSRVDGYFILDTRQGKQRRFQDQAHFETAARSIGIDLKLRPVFAVYSEFRSNWFDGFTLPLLVVPPLIGGIILIRRIVRLRRTVPQ